MNMLQRSGFSLIQISMLLTVASIVLVSMLPGGKLGDEAEKNAVTLERMKAIEEATKGFMARNLRRPCPADGTLSNNVANFGVEAATPGTCTGGVPAANFTNATSSIDGDTTSGSTAVTNLNSLTGVTVGSLVTGTGISSSPLTHVASVDAANLAITLDVPATATNANIALTFTTVVGGMVPVKTLGLPDEYALDGYGRRMMYLVDMRATIAGSPDPTGAPRACFDLQSHGLKGDVRILNSSTDTAAKDYVMAALVSYGKSGHGAFPLQGSAIADRIDASAGDTANTSDDSDMNAFVPASDNSTPFTSTTFTGQLVQKPPVVSTTVSSKFDDIVWYSDTTKNTCCIGKACNVGFNVWGFSNIGAAAGEEPAVLNNIVGTNMATGDINGDGMKDLVVSNWAADGLQSRPIYVILGKKTGWPVGSSINLTDLANGTGGFTINNNAFTILGFGRTFTIGDVDNDGYDDIIIGGSNDGAGSASYVTIVFGAASFTSPVSTASLGVTVGGTGSGLFLIYNYLTYWPGPIATADLNRDGIKDIIFGDYNGFPYPAAPYNGVNGAYIWVVWGRSKANWYAFTNNSDFGTVPGTVAQLLFITKANGFHFRTSDTAAAPLLLTPFSLAGGNVNADVPEDLLIGDYTANTGVGSAYLIFGRAAATWSGEITEAVALTSPAYLDITAQLGVAAKGLRFNAAGSVALGSAVALPDMDKDGCKDLFISAYANVYMYKGRKLAGSCNVTTDWPVGPEDLTGAGPVSYTVIDTLTNRPGWISSLLVPESISTGDVNNDGRTDLLLGVSGTNPDNCGKGAGTGSTYVLYQPSTGWPNSTVAMFTGTANAACDINELNTAGFGGGFRIDGPATGSYAYIPQVLDLNKDGKNDVAIAAPGYDSGKGGAYVVWGRKTLSWEAPTDLNSIDNLNSDIP